MPLTTEQRNSLNSLINFDDDEDFDDDDGIFEIDGIARPNQLCDEMLNKITARLLVEPFRTSDIHYQVVCEGFPQLMDALHKHGQGLSLLPGVATREEVVPTDLRHKLWLQACFDELSGLGQAPDINLPDQPWRVPGFSAITFTPCLPNFGRPLLRFFTRS